MRDRDEVTDREEEMLRQLAESLRRSTENDDDEMLAETLMLDSPPEEIFYNAMEEESASSSSSSDMKTNTTDENIRMEEAHSEHSPALVVEEGEEDDMNADDGPYRPSSGGRLGEDSYGLNVNVNVNENETFTVRTDP